MSSAGSSVCQARTSSTYRLPWPSNRSSVAGGGGAVPHAVLEPAETALEVALAVRAR